MAPLHPNPALVFEGQLVVRRPVGESPLDDRGPFEQVERRGRSNYSLFTGDVGVALYAADCLDARAAFPVLDGWG